MFDRWRLRAAANLLALVLGSLAGGGAEPMLASPPGNADFRTQTWSTESGLPQNTVHAILQSHDGYIWVGTEGGLARFDGVRFTIYNAQNTPALKSNNIRALAETRDGSLWIATADGIARLTGSQFTAFGTEQGLPSTNVWSLLRDHSGTVWAVTADGLARLSDGRFQRQETTARAALTGAIAASADGTLWLGTRSGIKPFGRTEPHARSGDLNAEVQELLVESTGTKWAGTPAGLYNINAAEAKPYNSKNGLPADRITALFEDQSRTVWIGTDAGLARIIDGRVVPLSPADALRSETILAITQDRDGDIWAGTASSGLTVLRPQRFVTFTARDGLSDDTVRCVLQDGRGAIWIGTNSGLTRYENGKFSVLTTRDGLASNVILALAEDTRGTLLVGTPDGLNKIDGGKISALTSADGLPDDFVRSILADQEGRLWIGTRRGLACVKDGGIKTYTKADGLGSDLVGAMLTDARGGLWVATLNGLTRLQNGKLTNYTTKDGLSSNVITSLYRDGSGTVWIGTQDGGLNAFIGDKFVHFPPAAGLPTVIYGITEDRDHDLWLSSNAGIYRTGKAGLIAFAAGGQKSIETVSYGTSDGLRVSETSGGGHPSIWRAHDGSLWFATLKGIAMVRGPRPELNRVPPGVVIESVSVDDHKLDGEQLKAVPPGYSRISFDYTGLSFAAPQKIRFRYNLEGFDDKWVDAGVRRTAYYTNLPAGKYRFRVRARNNDGFWSENDAEVALRLEPHFYQTYWFGGLLFVCAALLAWFVYHWRVREVEARFGAVLQERNRIAREIHDTLAQGFAGVSVQLEIVSRLMSTSTETAREHLDQARALVRKSLADARSSIWELRSQSNESEDLAARFSKMASQVAGSGPPKLELQVRGTYRPLKPKMEHELLKIAQEAVTNAVRHANAERIQVELAFDGGKLRMTIADDGRGFTGEANSSGPDGHFGLRGMRERAEQIDADLKVESAAGKGTIVSVEAAVN